MTRRTRGQGEGSIYQRASDGKWVAVVNLGWQDGKRRRKYLYGSTRKEAADKLTEALAKQRKGERIKHDRLTVAALLDRWHAEVIVPNRRPNTIAAYRTAIDRHLAPLLGDRPLARLRADDVQAMLANRRAAGLSPRTIAGALSVLRMALDYAVRLDLAPRNVAALVDRPRLEDFPAHPLPPDEARLFLASVADDRLSALYELSVRLGLRRGEACGLRWQDVDLAAGTLSVRVQLQRVNRRLQLVPPKTKQARRTINLTDSLKVTLQEHANRQDDERDLFAAQWDASWGLVFCNTKGRPLDISHLGRQLHQALDRAGLERRRWHDLRHTAVTLMLAAGVPERVIMDILGHTSLSMTRTYGAVIAASRRDALEAVEGLLSR